MQFIAVFRVLGVLLMLFSISMLPPTFIASAYHDGAITSFFLGFLLTLVTGFLLWFPSRKTDKTKYELKVRDGFIIVILFWLVLSLFGALPMMFAEHPHETLTDAMFEAVSGLTTTGATTISGLDHLPHAIRYYRQQLQFLGGMGIVVLAVAVLPMLGIGGMQLYRAETPGPVKDNKLTPRLTETAKFLWFIYVGICALCALAYWGAGMSFFEAICESFGTVSTGGFATHDASFAYYHSHLILMISVAFMIISGTNFGLHFLSMQRRGLDHYWADPEFRTYIAIIFVSFVIVAAVLFTFNVYSQPKNTLSHSLFTVVSIITTTGFTSTQFSLWPSFVPIFLMVIGLIGGCAASTSGGFKVIRLLLLHKQWMREVKRLIHPSAVLPIRFGEQIVPDQLVQAIWGFVSIFIALFVLLVLLLMATGLDLTTAFGSTVACLANVGPGLGQTVSNFQGVNTTAKWILIFAMLAGRLEIFTLLVIFSPSFWRY